MLKLQYHKDGFELVQLQEAQFLKYQYILHSASSINKKIEYDLLVNIHKELSKHSNIIWIGGVSIRSMWKMFTDEDLKAFTKQTAKSHTAKTKTSDFPLEMGKDISMPDMFILIHSIIRNNDGVDILHYTCEARLLNGLVREYKIKSLLA